MKNSVLLFILFLLLAGCATDRRQQQNIESDRLSYREANKKVIEYTENTKLWQKGKKCEKDLRHYTSYKSEKLVIKLDLDEFHPYGELRYGQENFYFNIKAHFLNNHDEEGQIYFQFSLNY